MSQEMSIWDELNKKSFDPTAIQADMQKNQRNQFIIKVGQKNPALRIRLLPNKHLKAVPYYTVYMHYNIARYGLFCAKKTKNEKCPICEVMDDMIKKAKTQEDIKSARKWNPTDLYYMACLDRSKKDADVKYVELTRPLKDLIMKQLLKTPKITHAINGHDFDLEYTKGDSKKKYGEKNASVVLDSCPIFENEEDIKKLLLSADGIYDFWSKYQIDSYDSIREAFHNYLSSEFNGNEEEEVPIDEYDSSVEATPAPTQEKPAVVSESPQSLSEDEELRKLFNQ